MFDLVLFVLIPLIVQEPTTDQRNSWKTVEHNQPRGKTDQQPINHKQLQMMLLTTQRHAKKLVELARAWSFSRFWCGLSVLLLEHDIGYTWIAGVASQSKCDLRIAFSDPLPPSDPPPQVHVAHFLQIFLPPPSAWCGLESHTRPPFLRFPYLDLSGVLQNSTTPNCSPCFLHIYITQIRICLKGSLLFDHGLASIWNLKSCWQRGILLWKLLVFVIWYDRSWRKKSPLFPWVGVFIVTSCHIGRKASSSEGMGLRFWSEPFQRKVSSPRHKVILRKSWP